MQDDKQKNPKGAQNRDNRGGKDEKLPENTKEHLDERLDEGVEETFPASDPVSVKITK